MIYEWSFCFDISQKTAEKAYFFSHASYLDLTYPYPSLIWHYKWRWRIIKYSVIKKKGQKFQFQLYIQIVVKVTMSDFFVRKSQFIPSLSFPYFQLENKLTFNSVYYDKYVEKGES